MPPSSRIPLLGALVFGAALLPVTTLSAQAPAERPAQGAGLLLAGGAAGQFDGDRDLGSPGLHLALGIRVPTRGTLTVGAEVQGFDYGAKSLLGVVGARGPAERLGVLAALATWAPDRSSRAYVLGGAGVVHARVTGAPAVTAGAGVIGAGLRVLPQASLEAQYLHAARNLGSTRSLVTARLQVRL